MLGEIDTQLKPTEHGTTDPLNHHSNYTLTIPVSGTRHQHPPAATIALTQIPLCCDSADTCWWWAAASPTYSPHTRPPLECPAKVPPGTGRHVNFQGPSAAQTPPSCPLTSHPELGLCRCRTEGKVSRSAYSRTKYVRSSRAFRSCSYDIRDAAVAVRRAVRAHPLL